MSVSQDIGAKELFILRQLSPAKINGGQSGLILN
jgi:hypothetical protein